MSQHVPSGHAAVAGEAIVDAARGERSEQRSGTTTRTRPTRPFKPRRATWQVRSLCVALALFALANLGVQLNRRYWDVRSDDVLALSRVQQCESLGRAPDVLYLGSSRTVFDIKPAEVETSLNDSVGKSSLSCNAGETGGNFEQDYYALKRFVEDGYAPGAVVETLWERNLNVNDTNPINDKGLNARRVLSLADLADAGDVATLPANDLPGPRGAVDFALGKLVPIYGDRLGLMRALCGDATAGPCASVTRGSLLDPYSEQHVREAVQYRGWAPFGQAMTQGMADAWAAHKTPQLGLQRFAIGGHDVDYLAKLIALARAHHIKVALVVTPMHPVYYAIFDRGAADWDMIAAYWRAFAVQHDVALYDQSHQPSYTTADFADPLHLDAAGAEKFSRWLGTNVVAPLLT